MATVTALRPLDAPDAIRAVLFDLDGTLLDTVGGIARALNAALAELHLAPLPVPSVRTMIGRGSPELVRRASAHYGLTDSAQQAALLQRYYAHYEQECQSGTQAPVYPQVMATLGALRKSAHQLGVVTNKQRQMSVDLLRRAGMLDDFAVVVGGDCCERRKPDPEPLHFACERLGVTVSQTLMVGDSRNDVLAARAAGMRIVCVSYGYNEAEPASKLGCDVLIDSLAQLPALLHL